MGFVEGTNRNQINMISLEEMVGKETTVRIIDKYIDSCNLEQMKFTHVKASKTGRPSYNAKELAKLYVYGYENGIRSSRKLEREGKINIEVMWLLEGSRPSHQTISEFRKENITAIQELFYNFTKLCQKWNLIGGKLIAVDGTKIKASNNKKRNFSQKKVTQRIKEIDEKIANYLESLEENDKKENEQPSKAQAKKETEEKVKQLTKRKEQYENYQKEMKQTGTNEISTTDKDAKLMGNNRNGVEVAYNIQSGVDAKNHIILEYEVTTNPTDYGQLSNIGEKIKKKYNLKKYTALADKGYYQGRDLSKCKKLKIKTIVSKQKPTTKAEIKEEYQNKNFKYNEEKDSYICPMNQELNIKKKKNNERNIYYNKNACITCENQNNCTTSKKGYREVTRSIYAKEMEETDARTKRNMDIYKKRQQIVEHPFGTVKRQMNGGYFLLRTKEKVGAEVSLLFLGYNLKRAIKELGFDKIMENLEAIISKKSQPKEILIQNSKKQHKNQNNKNITLKIAA